jgi:hypothetical protein
MRLALLFALLLLCSYAGTPTRLDAASAFTCVCRRAERIRFLFTGIVTDTPLGSPLPTSCFSPSCERFTVTFLANSPAPCSPARVILSPQR